MNFTEIKTEEDFHEFSEFCLTHSKERVRGEFTV